MTGSILTERATDWDKKCSRKKRKVMLITDICRAQLVMKTNTIIITQTRKSVHHYHEIDLQNLPGCGATLSHFRIWTDAYVSDVVHNIVHIQLVSCLLCFYIFYFSVIFMLHQFKKYYEQSCVCINN